MAVRDTLEPASDGHTIAADPEGTVAQAQRILSHRFADPDRLREALTHRSAAHGNRTLHRGERRGVGSNERLEFIGDRVLGLLIAEWLLERYPAEQEGELGPRQARLVSRTVLASVADQVGMTGLLAIAPNEARAGVGSLSTVLADAMEAAIGALYLDGGLEPARRFVRTAWSPVLDAMLEPPKDPKTQLQEWLAARGKAPPRYTVLSCEGPSHAPHFVIEVAGAGQAAAGEGSSKRTAERQAAAALLRRLRA